MGKLKKGVLVKIPSALSQSKVSRYNELVLWSLSNENSVAFSRCIAFHRYFKLR